MRLPATFTIRPGGGLDPPTIAAPARTTIVLSVYASDGRMHAFELATALGHPVMVRARLPARLLLKGLADGTYSIIVDRVKRGRLIVGASPGP